MTLTLLPSPLARGAVGLLTALALASPTDRLLAAPGRGQAQAAAAAGLRIVVIAGEDAVNVIQQKTAVAPIVEVRDKNDQPVAGVLVRFVVRGGTGATLNGQTALTVTTNAAGRAAVPAFNPTVAGTLEIDVSASSGGQVANTTIRQRTFRTAADAAKAGQNSGNTSSSTSSTSSSPGASAGAGAASGGGGIGAGTIAIAAVGVGAGAFALSKAGGGDSSSGGSSSGGSGSGGTGGGGTGGGGTGTTQNLTVSGPFTLTTPISWTYVGGIGTCTYTDTTTGTIRMTLQVQSSGAVSGTTDTTGTSTASALTCSFGNAPFPPGGNSNPPTTLTAPVTGTSSSLTFTHAFDVSDPSFTYAYRLVFTGGLANGVVTGTLREDNNWTAPGVVTTFGGSSSTQVTLR